MLGGAIDAQLSAARGQTIGNSALTRLTVLPDLMRRHPQARVVFTGGSGLALAPEAREAPHARRFLDSIGVDTSRILFESEARNTRENAAFSRALAAPAPGETWLLVTSAFHMPRAYGVFRKAGWDVSPWPVGFRSDVGSVRLGSVDMPRQLHLLDNALHEWLGLVIYRIAGRTDDLLHAVPEIASL